MEFDSIVTVLVDSFKGGKWQVFASACVMLTVFALTKTPLSGMLKGQAKIWTAAVCAVFMSVATTLAAGGDWGTAIMAGVNVALGAVGLFELVKRKLAKKPIDADNDGVLDEVK